MSLDRLSFYFLDFYTFLAAYLLGIQQALIYTLAEIRHVVSSNYQSVWIL